MYQEKAKQAVQVGSDLSERLGILRTRFGIILRAFTGCDEENSAWFFNFGSMPCAHWYFDDRTITRELNNFFNTINL